MQSNKLVEIINEALEDMQAIDIVKLDVAHLTSVTDFMVICSGRSQRHVQAIADNLVEKLKEKRIRPLHVDSKTGSEWVLVDYADVVVHIMLPTMRDFYNLEKLWAITEESKRKSAS